MGGKEVSVVVDMSGAECGLNAAIYFVEMDKDGDKGVGDNNAGPAYGTGYCDAQCPRDLKWVKGGQHQAKVGAKREGSQQEHRRGWSWCVLCRVRSLGSQQALLPNGLAPCGQARPGCLLPGERVWLSRDRPPQRRTNGSQWLLHQPLHVWPQEVLRPR